MTKYIIHITLTTGSMHSYKADKFYVIDDKLEISILNSIISYDFDLIDKLSITTEVDVQ